MNSGATLEASTVVVGSGPAGCALAARLAEAGEDVLVLEAGPDFGPRGSGRWPADLLDASALTGTLDWGYDSGAAYPSRTVAFERARVLGGCSSHNGCAAIRGARGDYDAWARAGNAGWATDDLIGLFAEAEARLRVYRYAEHEQTPFQAACLRAAAVAGIPRTEDLNDVDEGVAVGVTPVNIDGGVRVNAAFAFLDDLRARSAVRVLGDVKVAQVLLRGARAVGVKALHGRDQLTVRAERVVVAAGTYESPAILQRSGVGPADVLVTAGIEVAHDLVGVGANLHDHPAFVLTFEGTEDLRASHAGREGWTPEEQVIAKLASRHCQDGFDLHLYPLGGPHPTVASGWRWELPVACMTPRSRGAVRIGSDDPHALPHIDHRYLSDPDGHDAEVLADGVEHARAIADAAPLRRLIGRETGPCNSGAALLRQIREEVVHYYHPVGTCAMGPERDRQAVVGADGAVHGLEGLHVADCSVMPVVPRANTNLPAAVVGLRIADALLGQGIGRRDVS